MSHTAPRPEPTFRKRVAVLFVSQLLTMLGLLTLTGGLPWSARADGEPAAAPRAPIVMTVGNGYVVTRRDWQPPAAAGADVAPSALLPLTASSAAPPR
jgi:hypothetical protein